jgi:hypothetical protein
MRHLRQNSKFLFSFLLAGIIVFLSGCKTSRPTTSISLSRMEKEERIKSIQYQATPFNTISSSLRFSIKPGMGKSATSLSAQLRIIKDQHIQLSIRVPFLGTEAARISVTPEQVIIIDRINRRYVSEPMQTVKEKTAFDFDFYSLQALLTNQLFIAGKPSLSPENYNSFNLSEDEHLVKLNNKDNQGINYNFMSDYTNRILQTEIYKNKEEANFSLLYQDFGLTSNRRLFPMKMTMELTVPDDLITLNLSFNNVDIDANFNLDTSIPGNFQPMGIEQVIKLIQSF